LMYLALWVICKYAFWVIVMVSTIAVLRWTIWCLHCCSVSAGGALDELSVIQPNSDSLAPGWGDCGAKTCWCGNVKKMMMKRSGKSWGIYS
jgi:hypothetical protein